jgi:hypothetical protein
LLLLPLPCQKLQHAVFAPAIAVAGRNETTPEIAQMEITKVRPGDQDMTKYEELFIFFSQTESAGEPACN